MTQLEDQICTAVKNISNQQLKRFTQLIRRHLTEVGFDQTQLDHALKKAVKAFKEDENFKTECNRVVNTIHTQANSQENRGIDSIGRVLVEYCFFKTPDKKMIWPEGSKQDDESRKSYVKGVTPRPLMRYFLVSIRGSIPQLNKFEASSVLFGEENTAHEQRKKYVDDLIKEFVAPNQTGKRTVNWNAVYADNRFRQVALELIGDIRRKIQQFGLERYLRILENFRQRDPDRTGINIMERPFSIEDAKQLESALWAAEETLARIVE